MSDAAAPEQDAPHWRTLTLLSQGLALTPLAAQPLPAGGGLGAPPARAVLVATEPSAGRTQPQLLLPPCGERADAARLSLHAAMAAHAAAHLQDSPARSPSQGLTPIGMTVVAALEDARVERLLLQRYPGVRAWFAQWLAPLPDENDLSFAAFMRRLDRILFDPEQSSRHYWVEKARNNFEHAVATHGLQDYAAFRAVAAILANDLGQMRVRMDPQHYLVPSPYRDDNSYLWQHPQDAEQETALAAPPARPPSDTPPASDPSVQAHLPLFSYPEWNYRNERLRGDWCTVIEQACARRAEASASQDMPALALIAPPVRRQRRLDRRQRLRRQWEGEELDLNAAVDVRIRQRLGLAPEPRLFIRPGSAPQPTSLLVLLDASVSVNRHAEDGRTLLALEQAAARLLAQSYNASLDRLAIHAFCSNTRAAVSYERLLDFGQPWDSRAEAAIAALTGRDSTRLGAALRHACTLLAAEPPGQRMLLVITDSEPADIDVHDPRYLIEDAHQAVMRARQAGIRICGLAVDPEGEAYMRHIFGWRNYSIATQLTQLPAQLLHVSARLAAGR